MLFDSSVAIVNFNTSFQQEKKRKDNCPLQQMRKGRKYIIYRYIKNIYFQKRRKTLRWKACEKTVIFFNFIKIAKHTYSYAKFIVNSISENRFYLSGLKHEIFAFLTRGESICS